MLLYRVGDGDDCCVEGGPQDRWGMYSFPLYERIKAQTPEFDEVAAFQAGGARYGVRRQGAPSAKPLRSEFVTGNYFSTLGVRAFGGRLFTADDDKASAAPVVVMSHQAWQANYGSDPSVVGSTFVVEGHPFTLIGVAPAGFFGETLRGDPPDIWIPVQQEPLIDGQSALLSQSISAWLRVIGRLHPGASTAGMAPRLTQTLRRWLRYDSGYPSNWMPDIIRMLPKQVINVVPAGSGVAEMKEAYGTSLQILLAVCGMVLLIACANVANLLLARAVARRTQTALRLALGASRRQIIGQALIESVLLAIAGGLAGLIVAVAAARLLVMLAFRDADFLPISTLPSPIVLAFAFAVALLTGIIFGAAPAWFATRTNPVEALRGSGRSTSDQSSFARITLLIVQAALSVVLVAGATMLARSLNKLEHQDFGYKTQGRIVVSLNRPPATYTEPKLAALYRQIEEAINRLPGVTGSGLALYNPLTDNWGELIFVSGHPPAKMSEDSGASWDRVSANYLQNFGVTILRGRHFTGADNETTAPVAIVNEAFVKRFFKKTEDPLGQTFGLDLPENAGTFRIVGIAHDAKFAGFALMRYEADVLCTTGAKRQLQERADAACELQSHFIGGIMLGNRCIARRARASAHPHPGGHRPEPLQLTASRTMEHQVGLTFDQERAVASLAELFGVVALLLAAVGLYGVTAYTVAQRTNEIGIRMALGADRGNVVQYVLRGAFLRVAFGLGLGIPLAIGAGRLISSQLYNVSFWDPLALGVAAVALAVCALIAALIPASVAASISPMTALRSE